MNNFIYHPPLSAAGLQYLANCDVFRVATSVEVIKPHKPFPGPTVQCDGRAPTSSPSILLSMTWTCLVQ